MHGLSLLPDVLILLSVSVFIVVFFKKIKLSPVLGYLVIGAVIGEYGLDLIKDPSYAHNLSEFGVVFLLFAIGLELTFERLIKMRLLVFGFGGLQLILSTAAIAYALYLYLGFSIQIAVIFGASLALSSTAIVMQVLNENKRQSTQVGRLALSILLMQDLAVVPLLAMLPIVASVQENIMEAIGLEFLKAVAAIVVITIVGRLFLRPFFSIISSANSEDVYIPTTLLLVLGAALLTNNLGLSMAMGAFIAGILIAETEYRHRVESSIMPFKSLMLGLFFLVVGMTINVKFILDQWDEVLIASIALLTIKGGIIMLLCKLFKFRTGASIHSALLVSQGGEFAFILFNIAAKQHIIPQSSSQFLLMVVSVTMAITPLLSIIGIKIEDKKDEGEPKDKNQEFKGVSDLDQHVVIAGFGHIGRVIAYLLAQEKISYIAVDSNLALVKKARNEGYPVYHGDLSELDTIKAVGCHRASAVVLTMSEKSVVRKAVKSISASFPETSLIARVEDYRHAKGIRKLGADIAVPSAVETGLQLAGALLRDLGTADHEILTLKRQVRQNNYLITEEIELFKGLKASKINKA